MTPDHDVFQGRHLGKQADVLKGPRNARLSHLVHRAGLVRLACQLEAAAVGRVQTGDDVEERGFASTIGADQAVHLPGLNRHAHLTQGLQTAKTFGNTLDLQDWRAHNASLAGKALPCSGAGHKPRGRHSMIRIMANAISNWRKMAASKRPSVMACKGPAT